MGPTDLTAFLPRGMHLRRPVHEGCPDGPCFWQKWTSGTCRERAWNWVGGLSDTDVQMHRLLITCQHAISHQTTQNLVPPWQCQHGFFHALRPGLASKRAQPAAPINAVTDGPHGAKAETGTAHGTEDASDVDHQDSVYSIVRTVFTMNGS